MAHEEYNGADQVTEFLQMWVLPDEQGLAPSYDQQAVDVARNDGFVLVASPQGPVHLNVDACLYALKAPAGARLHHDLQRFGWLHLAQGTIELNGERLEAGDGVALASEHLEVLVVEPSDIVLWDLP